VDDGLTETGWLRRPEPFPGGGFFPPASCGSRSTGGMGGGGVGSYRVFSMTLFLTSRPSTRLRVVTSTEMEEGISSNPLLRELLRGGIEEREVARCTGADRHPSPLPDDSRLPPSSWFVPPLQPSWPPIISLCLDGTTLY
jgi:hypothetical protein